MFKRPHVNTTPAGSGRTSEWQIRSLRVLPTTHWTEDRRQCNVIIKMMLGAMVSTQCAGGPEVLWLRGIKLLELRRGQIYFRYPTSQCLIIPTPPWIFKYKTVGSAAFEKCDQNKMKSFDKDFLQRFPSKFVISSQRSNPADHNPLKFNTEASLFITFKYLETRETKHPPPVTQLTGIILSF